MSDENISALLSAAGAAIGYLYGFSASIAGDLLSGDRAALTRVLLTVATLYISLLLVQRTARMILGLFVLTARLAIAAAVVLGGVYVAHHGVEQSAHDATRFIATRLSLTRLVPLAHRHMRGISGEVWNFVAQLADEGRKATAL